MEAYLNACHILIKDFVTFAQGLIAHRLAERAWATAMLTIPSPNPRTPPLPHLLNSTLSHFPQTKGKTCLTAEGVVRRLSSVR